MRLFYNKISATSNRTEIDATEGIKQKFVELNIYLECNLRRGLS